ncbi:hypothetical protein BH11PAT3_BH11PAT3_2060 [soil metagenome]
MIVIYGIGNSPFGEFVVSIIKGEISFLSFIDTKKINPETKIKKVFKDAELKRDDLRIKPIIEKIFNSKKKFSKLHFKGTEFQVKVWKELLKIPYGTTSTYKEIAIRVGSPLAARAVGTACGRNHIPYIVPCHRVLASNGGIGGYNGGIKRKIAMLKYESSAILPR